MIKVASAMLVQIRSRGNIGSLGMIVRDDLSATPSSGNGPDHMVVIRRVVVDQVAPGPADKAGLRKGDEVLKVGEVPVGSTLDVQRALLDREGGQRLQVRVRRDGAERKIELTLERAPNGSSAAAPLEDRGGRAPAAPTSTLSSAAAQVWRSMGMRLVPLANGAEGDAQPSAVARRPGHRRGAPRQPRQPGRAPRWRRAGRSASVGDAHP